MFKYPTQHEQTKHIGSHAVVVFINIHILSYFPFFSIHSLNLSYLRGHIPRKYSVNSFIIERKRHEESTSTDELTLKGGAPVTSKFLWEMRQVFQYCSILCCNERVKISTNYNFKLHIVATKGSKYQPTIILNCTSFRLNTLFCTVTLLGHVTFKETVANLFQLGMIIIKLITSATMRVMITVIKRSNKTTIIIGSYSLKFLVTELN